MQLSTLNFGIFLAYWVDYGFTQAYTASFSWRVPCILQCVFLLSMLFLLFLVPESPRWLAAHAPPSVSLAVFTRLHSKRMSPSAIENLHSTIINTSNYEASLGAGKWSDLLHNDSIQSQRRFLTACALQSFQQLGGINALIYYSNTLFSSSTHLPSPLSTYVWLPSDLVLHCILHTVAPHRPHWSTTSPPFHDLANVRHHGCPNRPDLQCPERDLNRKTLRYRSCSDALPLRRRLHHRLPSYSLGLSVRDLAIASETER